MTATESDVEEALGACDALEAALEDAWNIAPNPDNGQVEGLQGRGGAASAHADEWDQWIVSICGAIESSRALTADGKSRALSVATPTRRESCRAARQKAIGEIAASCGVKLFLSFLQRIGNPPADCVLPVDHDECECEQVRTADEVVGEILSKWPCMHEGKVKNYKAKRRGAREVSMADASLRALKGNSPRLKLVSFVRKQKPRESKLRHIVTADMLYLMLATNTKSYTTVLDLRRYLKTTAPALAMTHIALDVLNKSVVDKQLVENKQMVDLVMEFYKTVAGLARA